MVTSNLVELFYLLDRSLFSFGTKISRLEEYMLTVTKSKNFVSVSVTKDKRDSTLMILRPVNFGY